MDIEFTNGQECFGMSGPWLGNCLINKKKLKNEFLIDNFAFTSDNKYVALSRYSDNSKWAKDREFKILILDIENHNYWISKRGFSALFIETINQSMITFYEAFHDEISNYKRTIEFSVDNFDKVEALDIFE